MSRLNDVMVLVKASEKGLDDVSRYYEESLRSKGIHPKLAFNLFGKPPSNRGRRPPSPWE